MNLSSMLEEELRDLGLRAERMGWPEMADRYFAELMRRDVNAPMRAA